MSNETEKQHKIFQLRPKIKSISELADAPVAGQDGQQLKFLTQEFQQMANMFSTKFDQQSKAMEVQRNANELLSNRVGRLSSTVANLTTKLDDKVVHGKDADLVIAADQDPDRADVATVSFAAPAEAYYPYTTSELALPVGIHASRLGYLFRLAKIQGNPKFHCAVKTGTTNQCQKYRGTAIKALYDAAIARKVPEMKLGEIQKLEKYFELQRAVAEYD